MNKEPRLAILIPSYDRPTVLNDALRKWLSGDYAYTVVVVAEGSSENILDQYRAVLLNHQKCGRLLYKLSSERLGSINARNLLLKLATTSECDFIVMADDDYMPPSRSSLLSACARLDADSKIGAIGGRVIVKSAREDGDFFLNSPFAATSDVLTKFSGYIFLDVTHGPRFSEYLTPFLIMKKDVAARLHYDSIYDTPTAFREESDLQAQIKFSGYKLLFDPDLEVVHLAISHGGNRPNISFNERLYWKARNSVLFVWKWNKSSFKRVWFTFFCTLILLLYRPWSAFAVLRGGNRGMNDYCNNYRVGT